MEHSIKDISVEMLLFYEFFSYIEDGNKGCDFYIKSYKEKNGGYFYLNDGMVLSYEHFLAAIQCGKITIDRTFLHRKKEGEIGRYMLAVQASCQTDRTALINIFGESAIEMLACRSHEEWKKYAAQIMKSEKHNKKIKSVLMSIQGVSFTSAMIALACFIVMLWLSVNSIYNTTIYCNQCHEMMLSDYCGDCGTSKDSGLIKRRAYCEKCNKISSSEDEYCSDCGTKITAEAYIPVDEAPQKEFIRTNIKTISFWIMVICGIIWFVLQA